MSSLGLIYDFFPGDNLAVVVDITGTTVGTNLQYSPDGSPANTLTKPIGDPAIPGPVSLALGAPTVTTPSGPVPVLTFLQNTPANLDALWALLVAPQIQSTIATQLQNALGKKLDSFTISPIPKSGRTRARVLSKQSLLLDYWVPNVNLNVTATFTPITATFHMNADVEILIPVFFQWPSANVSSSFNLLNVNIAPASSWTTVEYDSWSALEPQPFDTMADLMHYYEAVIQSSPPQPPDVSSVSNALAALGAAAVPLGLLQCVPSTDQSLPSPLTLTLIHPPDLAPSAYNAQTMASPNYGFLGGPILATSQSQVTPGSPIGVTGTQFPASSVVAIAWNDTCSGNVVSSVVSWGPQGQAMTPTSIPRPGNGPIFVLPIAAQAGQTYVAQVSDSDALTSTPPSNLFTDQSLGSFDLVLSYTSNSGGIIPAGQKQPPPGPPHPATAVVGTANAEPNGQLFTTAIIPPDAVPGSATLNAEALGVPLASVQFTIVASVQPTLELIDPSSGTVQTPVAYPEFEVYARGEGFLPGGEAKVYIDKVAGTARITTPVLGDGTFKCQLQWPQNLPTGPHSLLAVEKYSGETIQASLIVTQEQAIS